MTLTNIPGQGDALDATVARLFGATALTNPAIILALTLIGEDEGGGAIGMHAVANSVVNRANHPAWWGRDIIGVCRAPDQFDCWNAGTADYERMIATRADNPDYVEALAIANLAVAGQLIDITNNADSYFAPPRQPCMGALSFCLSRRVGRSAFLDSRSRRQRHSVGTSP